MGFSKDAFMEERENELYYQSLPPLKKTATKKEVVKAAREYIAGAGSDMETLYLAAKKLQDFASEIQAQLKDKISDSIEETLTLDGAEFKVMAAKTNWKFDHYNRWVEINTLIKEIEGRMKKVAEAPGLVLTDPQDDEVVLPAAIRTMGKPFIKVTY